MAGNEETNVAGNRETDMRFEVVAAMLAICVGLVSVSFAEDNARVEIRAKPGYPALH